MPITGVRTMEEWIGLSASQQRLNAMLLAAFAGVALIIAAIGVYGVLSYSVSQRTREIGLRMALGARQNGVLRLIVGEGLRMACAGIAIGLLGAFGLRALLFGIQGRDPCDLCGGGIVARYGCGGRVFVARAARGDGRSHGRAARRVV